MACADAVDVVSLDISAGWVGGPGRSVHTRPALVPMATGHAFIMRPVGSWAVRALVSSLAFPHHRWSRKKLAAPGHALLLARLEAAIRSAIRIG